MKATATISGPNDAYHVVWALGECFFLIIRWFYILTIFVYKFSIVQTTGPKRRCTVVWVLGLELWMRLEPWSFVLTGHHVITTTTSSPPPRHHHHHVITTPCHHHHPENTPVSIFFIFIFINIDIFIDVDIFIQIYL